MIRRFLSNPCNVYFSLWCLYLLQGTIYESSSGISQVVLLITLFLSLIYAFKTMNMPNKPSYFKGLSLLLLMYVVYGVALMLIDGPRTRAAWHPQTFIYLKNYLMSLLPIYSCYYFTIKGYLRAEMYKRWVVVFLIVAVAQYFRMQREVLAALSAGGSNKEEITNNIGYVVVSLIPCMMIFDKRPMFQYSGIGFCVVFALMGMKRGAILICAVALLLIIWYKMSSAKGLKKVVTILVVAVAISLIGYYVENLLQSSDYFNQRLEQTVAGDSSGRDTYYQILLSSYLNDDNLIHLLIGRGGDGTLKVIGNYAHQDWLETLTNQGMLGVFLFLFYWIVFFRTVRKKTYSYRSHIALMLVFCMYGLRTLFSMSIGSMSIYVTSVLGYALADGFGRDEELL